MRGLHAHPSHNLHILTYFSINYSAQSHLDLKEESISSTSRRREISEARSIVSYLAINEMGYSASEVGWALSINRENASRGAARGKKAFDKYEDFKDIGN